MSNLPDNFDSAAFDRAFPEPIKDLTPYEETWGLLKEAITFALKVNPPWPQQGKGLESFLERVKEDFEECYKNNG